MQVWCVPQQLYLPVCHIHALCWNHLIIKLFTNPQLHHSSFLMANILLKFGRSYYIYIHMDVWHYVPHLAYWQVAGIITPLDVVWLLLTIYTVVIKLFLMVLIEQWCSQGQGLIRQGLDLRGQGHSTSLVQTFLILADRTVTSLTQRKDVHNII